MYPLQKLVSETALYGLSSVLGRILHYLLVPLYTSVFLPAEYGIITEYYAYAAFMQVLYTYGMETTYFRFAQQKPASYDLAVSALLTSSLIFSSLLVLLATPITAAIGHPGDERYVYYLAATLAVDTVLAIPFAQLRLRSQVRRFAGIKLLQMGLNIVLNVVLLCICANIYATHHPNSLYSWVAQWYNPAKNVEYVFMTNLIANFVALPLLGQSLVQIKFRLSWQPLRSMLIYAFPLLLMGLAGTVNEMLSRVMLRQWLPPGFYPGQSNEEILGIFGACYKLAVFMPLSIQAFRYAAEPFFFVQAQQRNTPAFFSAVMHWFIIGACFILFAISINLDLIGELLLRKAVYRTALVIVPYLLLAYMLGGVYYNLSVWFKLTDKTHYGSWLTAVGALINIVLNVTLIPHLGYWGSVWATVTSNATMSGLCYYWGKKYYPIPYRMGRQLLYVLGTFLSIYLVRSLAYTSWIHTVVSNLVLTGLFGVLLYVLGKSKRVEEALHESK